jgi:hypothetical protein
MLYSHLLPRLGGAADDDGVGDRSDSTGFWVRARLRVLVRVVGFDQGAEAAAMMSGIRTRNPISFESIRTGFLLGVV